MDASSHGGRVGRSQIRLHGFLQLVITSNLVIKKSAVIATQRNSDVCDAVDMAPRTEVRT